MIAIKNTCTGYVLECLPFCKFIAGHELYFRKFHHAYLVNGFLCCMLGSHLLYECVMSISGRQSTASFIVRLTKLENEIYSQNTLKNTLKHSYAFIELASDLCIYGRFGASVAYYGVV